LGTLTPTVIPAQGEKSRLQASAGWLFALVAIPTTAYYLFTVAGALDQEWGAIGIVVGLALFPVTILVMPFFAGLAQGEWLLLGLLSWLVGAGWLFALLRNRDLAG
jgi:hypothetical protein